MRTGDLNVIGDLTSVTGGFAIVFDGGGSAIAANTALWFTAPFACTITGYDMLADTSGSMVVDVWKDTYANYPPTVADSMCTSAKPTISSAVKATGTTSGWDTTSVASGSTLKLNVDSCTAITKCTVELKYTRA